DVEHVVIFMQENRSFDHYFGGLRGEAQEIASIVRGHEKHPVVGGSGVAGRAGRRSASPLLPRTGMSRP
ncbi:alkaline phosphatase family protein, partial [Burkholderia cenocepacia]